MSVTESGDTGLHRVSITGAPPEVQRWIDDLVQSAELGDGSFPHPHKDIPQATLSLAELEPMVLDTLGSLPWAPSKPAPGKTPPSPPDPGDPDGTNPGSAYHNLLHKMLGNFH